MLTALHHHRNLQRALGLLMGVAFGFLLQKGGVTRYDIIIGQLLFLDWTVVKVMLTAVAVGSVGVHFLRSIGYARLQPKAGSAGMSVAGGLVFGVGFAVLGYCPGTVAGAAGQGSLDAILAGLPGIVLGSWLFAVVYPHMDAKVLRRGYFGEKTVPELLGINPWGVVIPVVLGISGLLYWLQQAGY